MTRAKYRLTILGIILLGVFLIFIPTFIISSLSCPAVDFWDIAKEEECTYLTKNSWKIFPVAGLLIGLVIGMHIDSKYSEEKAKELRLAKDNEHQNEKVSKDGI